MSNQGYLHQKGNDLLSLSKGISFSFPFQTFLPLTRARTRAEALCLKYPNKNISLHQQQTQ
jgi:hypothetical protein